MPVLAADSGVMTTESTARTPTPKIEELADHLDLVPVVAAWHWREWRADEPPAAEAKFLAVLAARTRRDEVPFTLIALLGDELVGSISACWDDLDAEFADEGPWLSGLFVVGAARDLGIGRRLLEAAEARALDLGHDQLWAHTGEAERFYVRCGWEVVRPKEPLVRDAVVRRVLG